LVKQILAFSRQANIERIPLRPSLIVKEAIKLLRPSLPATITIIQKIDNEASRILADPTQLHQIIMNLCTNSFHAMEKLGGVLNITLTNCELTQENLQDKIDIKPGLFVLLSVSDTGEGINPEILKKIFDPYFTTKEPGKGTGMGLAIIHGIVESYGGFVTCESVVGQGTIFRLFFPAMDHGSDPEELAMEMPRSGKETVLLVDDEEILADLGTVMLEKLGYTVIKMTNSIDAWNFFQGNSHVFDAVVTDQTMPDLTGIDLARKILQVRPELPVILCTGYSNIIDEDQALREGVKGFIMKPYSKNEISSALRNSLDKKSH
jgi:CheY-like chemotaxis protein